MTHGIEDTRARTWKDAEKKSCERHSAGIVAAYVWRWGAREREGGDWWVTWYRPIARDTQTLSNNSWI